MKTILVGRIKKWIIFAVIGCSAYFVGYFLGHKNPEPEKSTPTIQSPRP